MVNKPEALCRLDAQRKMEMERRRNLAEIYARHQRAVALQTSHLHQFLHSGAKEGEEEGAEDSSSDASSWSGASSEDLFRNVDEPTENLARVDTVPSQPEMPLYSYTRRRVGPPTVHGTLQGRTVTSDLPQVLYAHLDSGYIFECHISSNESDSYISYELFLQIRPRPMIAPSRSAARLKFNGEYYNNLGFVTFTMKMFHARTSVNRAVIEDETSKSIDRIVTAAVVPNLFPDMFLGTNRHRASRHR